MNEVYLYFMQSGLNIAILFMIYWLFLRRETIYQANRYYLLVSLVASFLLPLMKIQVDGGSGNSYIQMLEPVVITPRLVAEQLHPGITSGNMILAFYLVGSAIFLGRMLFQLFMVYRLVRKSGITHYKGLKLVLLDRESIPFSMFNLIFIHRDLPDHPEFEKIIEHESAHVRQYHTLDLLLTELFIVIQWFNPFIWLVRSSLKSIHEYIADRKVLSTGHSAGEYKRLLLNQVFGVQLISLSNNFNHSLTKKRFIMMSKKSSKAVSLVKMMLIIPAAVAMSIMFTVTFTEEVMAVDRGPDMLTPSSNSAVIMAVPQEEPVFTVVEEMPKYPGGQDALIKYMMTNVKYPENARKNGVQGTVFITFVVEKDGKVTQAKVLRGVDEELDKEALRVVQEMPKWNPGKEKGNAVRVQFNLPVAFKLDGGKTEEKAETPKRFEDVKKIDK